MSFVDADYVGGLVGYNNGGTIQNSSATSYVADGGDGDMVTLVGGLVGSNTGTGTIQNSRAAWQC